MSFGLILLDEFSLGEGDRRKNLMQRKYSRERKHGAY
jgi:hypothetical protein